MPPDDWESLFSPTFPGPWRGVLSFCEKMSEAGRRCFLRMQFPLGVHVLIFHNGNARHTGQGRVGQGRLSGHTACLRFCRIGHRMVLLCCKTPLFSLIFFWSSWNTCRTL